MDNFYDEARQKFSGEKRSVTKFSYEVTGKKDGILTIKNVFDVRGVTGEKIFSVERLYGIDPKTGKHVVGFGDRDRDGYLFAPRDLKKGEQFTYWHINYDAPARMEFAEEEDINGLQVYRYETRYEGVRIDQTKNLGNLPGVSTVRGIELEPHLQLWVEPVSGHMVKYQDDTIAYYYDLKTGARQNPWNHFSNTYTLKSVLNQVEFAKQEKLNVIFVQYISPILLMLLSIVIILFKYRKNKTARVLIAFISILALFIGGYFVVQKNQPKTPKAIEKITIAWAPNPVFGLMYVAEEKGYFEEEGLEVTYNKFSTGRDALNDAILKNSDIAMVYEAPTVRRIYQKDPVSIISTLHYSTKNAAIVGKKDKGIQSVSNLEGKKVGVVKGTAEEFFFFSFLTSQGIKLSDVTLVNGEFTDMIKYLRDGKTDAVVATNPYLFEIRQEFGDSISIFQSEIYTESSLLAGNTEVIKSKKEAFIRLLRALLRAEQLYESNPEEALQAVIVTLPQFSEDSIRGTRAEYVPKLKLDNVLLTVLNLEGQWFKDNGIYKTEVPDFRKAIFTDYLKEVQPEAVTLY